MTPCLPTCSAACSAACSPLLPRRHLLGLAPALWLTGCAAPWRSADRLDPAQTASAAPALAPTGRLRVAINYGNPVLAQAGANSEPTGVSVDLAREAARRLGLPLDLVTFQAAGKVVAALQAQEVDLSFVAIDPVRGADLDYTPPYVIIEGAYLVRQESPLQENAEVDRPGNRVVVGRGSAYDLYLSRALQAATLVRAESSPKVTEVFLQQGLEVAAGVRQQLEADARRLGPGLRLLPGRFMVIEQALALPKGRPAAARVWLAGFIEDMKARGEVAAALQRHGIQGAAVAPAADQVRR